MSERQSSEGTKPIRTVSRRRVLGATALAVAGAGGFLGSVAPAQARTVDFGDVALGSSQTRGVTTENPVNRPLEVTDLTITGPDAEAFSIVDGDAPFDLGPSESRSVRIRFAPTSPGAKSARVRADTTVRSSLKAGRLTGTGVEEGAASVSSEENTSSESEGTSETESNDDSSSAEPSTSSVETDGSSASESSSSASADDSTTERGTTSDPAGDAASTDQPTVTSAGASSSETSPTSGDATEESASGATGTDGSSAPGSGTENTPGGPDNDAGTRLTNLLDVNDDGSVNLQDFLFIIRRRGLNVNR